MTRVRDEEKALLASLKEPMPDWLAAFQPETRFSLKDFQKSRVVIYPGSGTDGGPVELFGSTHTAHCFVYADYIVPRKHVEDELDHPTHGFKGYRSICRQALSEADLKPHKWTPHVATTESDYTFRHSHVTPFGFLEVLERNEHLDDTHGAKRLAIVFLGADGIATYDALFCQDKTIKGPFALVVVDHGFGGGYARFDDGGLLHKLAKNCSVFPEYIWSPNSNSHPWKGYDAVGSTNEIRSTLYKQRQRIGG